MTPWFRENTARSSRGSAAAHRLFSGSAAQQKRPLFRAAFFIE
jgi:hypothetical protein